MITEIIYTKNFITQFIKVYYSEIYYIYYTKNVCQVCLQIQASCIVLIMDLTRNKRIRSGHINAFKRILDNSLKPIYRDYAEEKLIELKSLLDMLVAKYTKIVGIQDVIISLTDAGPAKMVFKERGPDC